MRFLMRGILGLGLMGLTMGLLVLSAGLLFWAAQDKNQANTFKRERQERVVSVLTAQLTPVSFSPIIETHGVIQSGQKLEIRPEMSGRVVEVSPNFRDGGRVLKGDLLFKLDDADAQSAYALAKVALREAQNSYEQSKTDLKIATKEIEAAKEQEQIRLQAYERQKSLKSRKVGTDAAVEEAELALSSARTALVATELRLAQAETALSQAGIAVSIKEIELKDAERTVRSMSVFAPFSGMISGGTALLGRQVSANEKLGDLIDLYDFEVVFSISNDEFKRLGSDWAVSGQAKVEIFHKKSDAPFYAVPVRLTPTSEEDRTGRQIIAKLEDQEQTVFFDGDFVTVKIIEPALESVFVVEATAMGPNETLLVVDAEQRLDIISVSLLRRQEDLVVINGPKAGLNYVQNWQPGLGKGVKVKSPMDRIEGKSSSQPAKESKANPQGETVPLTAQERAELSSLVKESQQFDEKAKKRILAELQNTKVPKTLIERLRAVR